jgi:hypothetical protein
MNVLTGICFVESSAVVQGAENAENMVCIGYQAANEFLVCGGRA